MALRSRWDVVVVGAGPAGCAAAITTASRGLSVLLLDDGRSASAVPESLHSGALTVLDLLGAGDALAAAALGRRSVGQGLGVAASESLGADSEFSGTWDGWHIDRGRFDARLRQHAEGAGAHRMAGRAVGALTSDGRVVGVRCKDRPISARFVIDASGATQWLRRHLGFDRRHLSPPLLAERGLAAGPADAAGSRPSFIVSATGWLWLAPLDKGRYAWTSLSIERSTDRTLLLANGLRPVGAVERNSRRWCFVWPTAGAGFFVCGEAGGFLDPASGDGVALALASGRLAGIALWHAVQVPRDEPSSPRHYSNWWRRNLGQKARKLALRYVSTGLGCLLRDGTSRHALRDNRTASLKWAANNTQ
jgi:flavin-dependent dehydrogenase